MHMQLNKTEFLTSLNSSLLQSLVPIKSGSFKKVKLMNYAGPNVMYKQLICICKIIMIIINTALPSLDDLSKNRL